MNKLLETFVRFVNKDKKSKNTPLCIEKKVSGKLFHASPKGVKRMEALNKLANIGVLGYIFRLDWHIFSSFSQLLRIEQRPLLLILLTLLPFSIIQAAQDENLLATQIKHCQGIADNQLRLSCYDQINQESENLKESKVQVHKISQFPSLIADLDEANLYISYGKLDFLGNDFNAVLFGGGVRQSVKSFDWSKGKPFTFNVFGQIRSQFDVSELDTRNNRGGALINTDFSIGGELVQSLDHWNWRLSYTHRSTHLGDEFIIDNQNYLEDRLNLSYETVKWTAHTSFNDWDLYAGVGLVTRSEPGNLDKVMWHLGWQYAGNKWHGFKPILAVDLKSWGAYDWNINANMRAGIEIDQWTDKPFQLLFEYHDGHSPYGQFFEEDLTFTGFTFLQNW